ncbi:MAG: hypothetical protein ACLP6E_02415 [Acidimicrobiales bacterium]
MNLMLGQSTSFLSQPPVTEPVGGNTDPWPVHDPGNPRVVTQHEVEKLADALEIFLAVHSDSVIGTSRVMNPLLTLWEAAHDVSDAAAEPIERMLTVLVKRQHTSHDELARMVDEVREAVRSDTPAHSVAYAL